MNTEEFNNRCAAAANQILDILNEVENEGLVEENKTETQGKISVKNYLNKIEVNLEALESVAQRHFGVSGEGEQLNG